MPAYNVEKYISFSIDSVLLQTYSNWELIVIDDCSTDNTRKIICSYKDNRILLIENRINLGAAESRNIAIEKARGKYIAFLDGDDIWTSNKLEKQIEFMEINNYSFTYTNYQEMSCNGDLKDIFWTGPKVINKFKLFNYDYIGCLTMMYNQEKLGKYKIINLKKRNDYALKLKIINDEKCYLLDEVLAIYRVRTDDSLSSRNKSKLTLLRYYYEIYHKSENMNRLESVINVTRNVIFGVIKKIIYKRKI